MMSLLSFLSVSLLLPMDMITLLSIFLFIQILQESWEVSVYSSNSSPFCWVNFQNWWTYNSHPLWRARCVSTDDSASAASSMEVTDRIASLEQRVQMQEDEIQLLKSALADVVRRLNVSEEQQAMGSRRGPTKGKTCFRRCFSKQQGQQVFASVLVLSPSWRCLLQILLASLFWLVADLPLLSLSALFSWIVFCC